VNPAAPSLPHRRRREDQVIVVPDDPIGRAGELLHALGDQRRRIAAAAERLQSPAAPIFVSRFSDHSPRCVCYAGVARDAATPL